MSISSVGGMDLTSGLNINAMLLKKKGKKGPLGTEAEAADTGTDGLTDLMAEVPVSSSPNNAGDKNLGTAAANNPFSVTSKNTLYTNSASSNVMAGNFASSPDSLGSDGPSEYVQATMRGLKADQQVSMSSKQVIMDAVGRAASQASAKMAVRRHSSKKVMEAAKENLDETRENIEQLAAEAAAPKDADGNPILDAPAGVDGGSATVTATGTQTEIAASSVNDETASGTAVPSPVDISAMTAAAVSAPKISVDVWV